MDSAAAARSPSRGLASNIVDVAGMAWVPTRFKGIDAKVLFQDETTGMLTCLFRWAPGAALPLHEHVEIEQSYVVEGSFEDDQGVVTAGNFVSRPAGSRHTAHTKTGAVILAFFLKPNVFIGPDGQREVFSSKPAA